MLLFFGMTLGAPLLPMITNELNSKNERLEKVNMLSTWGLGVLLVLPLLAFPEVIQALYGKEFDAITLNRTFILVMLATSVIIYKQGLARVLMANGMMWWALFSNSFWAVALLVGAFFLIPWGAIGLATAIAAAYILNTIVFIPLYTNRKLVPKGTIISFEAAVIWFILLIFAVMSWTGVSIILRAISLPVGFCAIFLSFRSFMKTSFIPKRFSKGKNNA